MIRTLIVDDEPLARERIRTLLAREPDFTVVGECEGGAEAIAAIRSEKPDLVFLDIQMPEVDGFDVLLALGPEAAPLVVFVTAYDQYAVRAFEVHALDYLLKPFDRDRFAEALGRVRARFEKRDGEGDFSGRLARLLDELREEKRGGEKLLVKTAGSVLFLSSQEIDWIEAQGNYASLHVGEKSYLMRETMAELEQRLPANRFVRIHRSTIVNFDRIKELRPLFNGDYQVLLATGKKLKLSRRFRAALEACLGRPI